MNNDIAKILADEEETQQIVKELSAKITNDYKDRSSKLLLLGILKGSVVFMGDLMKHIDLPIEIDFMKVSSYGSGTASSGKVNIMLDLHRSDMANLDVLIVEDIIDTGFTMKELLRMLEEKHPAEIHISSLLVKPGNLQVDLDIPYRCFDIANEFIVGYGLDYDHEGRNLRHIYQVVE